MNEEDTPRTDPDGNDELVNPTVDEDEPAEFPNKRRYHRSIKNPAAVSLGRMGGLKGGRARADSMTKLERSEAARKAALGRWRKNILPE